MKLKLKLTQFKFIDEETNNNYDVISPDSKHTDNKFMIYKNGNYITTYKNGFGHINKTQAKAALAKAILKESSTS